jgi:hypothetical protein
LPEKNSSKKTCTTIAHTLYLRGGTSGAKDQKKQTEEAGMAAVVIKIDGQLAEFDLKDYPPKFRAVDVFLDLAEKNPGKNVVMSSGMEIIGWRRDGEAV